MKPDEQGTRDAAKARLDALAAVAQHHGVDLDRTAFQLLPARSLLPLLLRPGHATADYGPKRRDCVGAT